MKKFLALGTMCVFFSAQGMETINNKGTENLKEVESQLSIDLKRNTYLTYEITSMGHSYSASDEYDNCVVQIDWTPANWKPHWYSEKPICDPVALIIRLNCSHKGYTPQISKFIDRIESKMREKYPHRTSEIIWDYNPRDISELTAINRLYLQSIGFICRGGTLSKEVLPKNSKS